jgi:hypothetical protein
MTHKGTIQNGSQDASGSWNWPAIQEVIQDQAIYRGTINVALDNFSAFVFSSDISFPEHRKPSGFAEGLRFQRCVIRIADQNVPAYIVKTDADYWAQHGIVEVIAARIGGAVSGVRAVITISN